jgi:hypothetical protein
LSRYGPSPVRDGLQWGVSSRSIGEDAMRILCSIGLLAKLMLTSLVVGIVLGLFLAGSVP